jgi:hypothetical protein
MSRRKRTSSGRPARRVLCAGALALALYLYVCLAVDPRLIYHFQCPIFQTDGRFFGKFLFRPAGLTEYLSAVLGQAYFWRWTGALVVAGVVLAACLAGGVFLSAAAGRRVWWVPLLAAAPLVALHSSYSYPLHVSLAVVVALAAAAGYARVPLRGRCLRWLTFAGLSVLVYYLAGAAMLLSALLCGLYELLVARRWILGAVGTAFAAAVPYGAARLLESPDVAGAYQFPLAFAHGSGRAIASIALYSLFPAATIGLALRGPAGAGARAVRRWAVSRRKGREEAPEQVQEASAPPPSASSRQPPAAARQPGNPGRESTLRWLAGTLALLVLCAASAWASFDQKGHQHLRLDYLSRRGDWRGVLREARRMPLRWVTTDTIYNVNRALFHAGRLPHDMFSYPQKRGMNGLMFHWNKIPQQPGVFLKLSDLMFELGHVNGSEHMACEALELLGDRPHLLKRLFGVYVVKGQPVAARTFLGALEKSPLYAEEARRLRRMLREDPRLENVPEIRQTRSRLPRTDQPGSQPAEALLLQLLDSNRHNRMAFEYLMAHYLLTGQLDKVAENIARLHDFGVAEIPRHYEEALLLYAYSLRVRNQVRPIPLHGLRLRPGAQERLEEFLKTRARFGSDAQAAQKALNDTYGDSYYFYYTFGMTTGGAA